jgi:enamine deaminase RidA (YjgF/YER057c/UK114 family)
VFSPANATDIKHTAEIVFSFNTLCPRSVAIDQLHSFTFAANTLPDSETYRTITDKNMVGKVEQRLEELGVELPNAPAPAANYVPYTIAGKILTISGQITMGPNGLEYVAKLGDDADIATGQAAARLCAINILAQAKAALGDLDRIKQVMKIQGFVNSTPDFTDHPAVINGASDFLVEVLGDSGKHARAAVGMSSLPLGVAVEVDATIEIA